MERDVTLLKSFGLMDYSLLLGVIHQNPVPPSSQSESKGTCTHLTAHPAHDHKQAAKAGSRKEGGESFKHSRRKRSSRDTARQRGTSRSTHSRSDHRKSRRGNYTGHSSHAKQSRHQLTAPSTATLTSADNEEGKKEGRTQQRRLRQHSASHKHKARRRRRQPLPAQGKRSGHQGAAEPTRSLNREETGALMDKHVQQDEAGRKETADGAAKVADEVVYDAHGVSITSADQEERYMIGIIDILAKYNGRKKVSHAMKSVVWTPAELSTVPADFYGERFLSFLKQHFQCQPNHKERSNTSSSPS